MSTPRNRCREALWPGNPPGAPDRKTQEAMLGRLMVALDSLPVLYVSTPNSHMAPPFPHGADPFNLLGEH